jgi:hypothetical protein
VNPREDDGDTSKKTSKSVNGFLVDSSLLIRNGSSDNQGENGGEGPPGVSVMSDLIYTTSAKVENKFQSNSVKNNVAMDAMSTEIQKNQNVANFVEIKVTTENQISAIFQ